ncbi:LysR substrate-binding domain-containing protein [Marinomonas epiphytica]
MKRLPPLNTLKSFVVTARQPSFTHAAKELHLSQGAISRQISALEDYLGFALFQRHARGLRLTKKGGTLLPLIEKNLQDLEATLSTSIELSGPLRLKIPTCTMSWFFHSFSQFKQQFPQHKIEITTTFSNKVDFSRDPFDAAIVYDEQVNFKNQSCLIIEKLVPVCSPNLNNLTELTLTNLANYRWLHPTFDQRDWDCWLGHKDNEAAPSSDQPTKNQHFESMDLAIQAAINSQGIAMADVTLIQQELKEGKLTIPFDTQVATGLSFFLVAPDNQQPHPALRDLTDWLKQLATC